jgi:hypothetical protein
MNGATNGTPNGATNGATHPPPRWADEGHTPLPHAEPIRTPVAGADLGDMVVAAWPNVRARLASAFADFLVDSALLAAERLTRRLPEAAALGPILSALPGHDPRGARTEASPAHRAVLVVGLKGDQKTLIEREFGHMLDLRFYGVEQSSDTLRAKAAAAEIVVAMSGFISHSHTDIIKARKTEDAIIIAPGGMAGLRARLRGLVQSPAH